MANMKKMVSLFLVFSLLLAICEIDHFFCKINNAIIFGIEHKIINACEHHHCSDSEENHHLHSKHYNCCDSEEPHDHPVSVPVANTDCFSLDDAITVPASLTQISCREKICSVLNFERDSQRIEPTYELLLCNDTIVLTI